MYVVKIIKFVGFRRCRSLGRNRNSYLGTETRIENLEVGERVHPGCFPFTEDSVCITEIRLSHAKNSTAASLGDHFLVKTVIIIPAVDKSSSAGVRFLSESPNAFITGRVRLLYKVEASLAASTVEMPCSVQLIATFSI